MSKYINNALKDITIHEYGLLTKGGENCDLRCRSISADAFDWLLINGQSIGEKERELVRVKRLGKSIVLQVVNFVGVLETPCGTRIEILPKISTNNENPELSRQTLLKMLSVVSKLKLEQFHQSSLKIIKQPLFEVLISQFLQATSTLIKKGLRSQYKRIERESSFLKGQLLTAKQIRQRAGRLHYFQVSHDVFTTDRPENRLLHSSLIQVLKWTKSSNNQRLARELLFVFHDIHLSRNYKNDFREWSKDRSLAHYRNIKPWCELILSQQTPITMIGSYKGLSFLFPMEVLFERYVAAKLKQKTKLPLVLSEQVNTQALAIHKGNYCFKLRPDIVLYKNKDIVSVMDTKWKILNQGPDSTNYNLSQSDMYQLFAYGEKYMEGKGELYLIYPKHEKFDKPLDSFHYKAGLRLNVVPYDLVNDECDIRII